MLDRHASPAVRRRHLPHALEALVFSWGGDRQTEPAVNTRGCNLDPTTHLVLDLSSLLRLAVECQWLVEVVLAVVALHVPDDQQLPLDRLAGLAAGQNVELGRPFHWKGQAVCVAQPRLMAGVGSHDLLNASDRHHRDVPLDGSTGTSAGDLHGAAQRHGRIVHFIGERVQVLGFPLSDVRRGQTGGCGEPEPDGPAEQPFHLGRRGWSTVQAG